VRLDPGAVPQAQESRQRGPADRRPLDPHIHVRRGLPGGRPPRGGGVPYPPVRRARPPRRPSVRVYVGGCGQWRDLPEWPPPNACTRSWYFSPDGTLGEQPPAQAGTSSFRYDSSDPTPSTGGPVLSGTAGSVDNTCLEARPDVLTFATAPLAGGPGDPRPGQRPPAAPLRQPAPRRVRPAVRCRPRRNLAEHLRRPDPASGRRALSA
jgi:hypothetical protein